MSETPIGQKQGAPGGQRVSFEQALQLATQHLKAGRKAQALDIARRVAEAPGAGVPMIHRAALMALQLGEHKVALAGLERAATLLPSDWSVQSHLGELLRRMGYLNRAVATGERAVALAPNQPEVLLNLAAALLDRRDARAALPLLQRVQQLKPGMPTTLSNLGNAHRILGELPPAVACYRAALTADPKSAEAHSNIALSLRDLGDRAGARHHLETTLTLQPAHGNARATLAMLDLLEGNFGRGWAGYEARWASNEMRPRQLPMPAWQGEPLDGRHLFVHAEQGHGDTIHMARYLPLLTARGTRVTCEAQPALLGLLRQSLPDITFQASGSPLPVADLQVPLLSLPRLFDTTLTTIPSEVPYLQALPETVALWRRRLDELAPAANLRVGVVWGGSRTHRGDFLRSVTPADLAPLAALPGVSCFSLQFGERAAEAAGWTGGSLVDLAPELGDFANTAGALVALDQIVTVDTANAHLAGALGAGASVLLSAVPDWRWLLGRDDSPWYPTLKLFRQPAPNDWASAIAAAVAALAAARDKLVAQRMKASP